MASNWSLRAIKDEARYLRDRQDILDLARHYSFGNDRHDKDAIASIYHPDAIDDHGRFFGGVKEFCDWAPKMHAESYDIHSHHITNHMAEIDGDVAHAESYFIVNLRRKDGSLVHFGSGRYLDKMERRKGVWKIALRRLALEWRFQVPAAVNDEKWASLFYPQGVFNKTDLTYMRPLDLTPEAKAELAKKGVTPRPARMGKRQELPKIDTEAKKKLISDHLRYLRDRSDIRDTIMRYARGVDRHDNEMIAEAYHLDAIDNRGTQITDIPEFIERVNGGHSNTTIGHAHHITTQSVEITGDVAHAESYVLFTLRAKTDDTINFGSARYVDRLEKRGGQWKIALRRIPLDFRFQGKITMREGMWHVDRNTEIPMGTWDKSDISYMRPLDLTPEKKKRWAEMKAAAK